MTAIAIEKYNIKGFPAPRPITSEAQNEYYTEVLYSLERRGHLYYSYSKHTVNRSCENLRNSSAFRVVVERVRRFTPT
jgi:hypothetical protein